MRIIWKDRYGYPIEGFIGKSIKSFIRLICQIIRLNIRITIEESKWKNSNFILTYHQYI